MVQLTVSPTGTFFNVPSRPSTTAFGMFFPTGRYQCASSPFAGDRRSVERYRTRFNLVAVIVTEPGYPASQPSRLNSRPISLLIPGFGLQVIVAHHVATNARRGAGGVATLAFAVQNVVRVELVQASVLYRLAQSPSSASSPRPWDRFRDGLSCRQRCCGGRNADPASTWCCRSVPYCFQQTERKSRV